MGQADFLDPAWRWLVAAAIALARPAGMLALSPVFTRLQLSGLLRGAVAFALAWPAIPHLAGQVAAGALPPLALLGLTFKEAALGAVLGFVAGLPFWAFEAAGDLLDQQRGATAGRLNDPAGFEDVSITGTLLLLAGIALFVGSGGLRTLASLLYASWSIWPPLAAMPAPTAQAPRLVLGFLDALLRQGVLLAAPLVLAMLLADAALILVGRFAPQLRLDDLGLSVRNLVFAVVLPLYCVALLGYMREDVLGLPSLLDLMRRGLDELEMSGAEEKRLPPTARKLRQARKRGEVPRSRELVTACVTLGAVGMLFWGVPRLAARLDDVLGTVAALEGQSFPVALSLFVPRLLWAGAETLGPFLLVLVLAAVLSGVAGTGGLVLSLDPVLPKLERIDPVKGFARLFNLRGLVELAKSLAKLAVVCAVAALVLRDAVPALVQVPGCGVGCAGGVLRALLLPLVLGCGGVFLLLALLDVGLQRWLFRRDQRMTRSEHKRDNRDGEGDPELRQRRRRERDEEAKLGVRMGLRHATFLVQGRDAALAFRYVRGDTRVPVLVARAQGEGAARMAAEARRRGVPVVFDTEAVQALVGQVGMGRMVPKEAFGPVIQAMREAGVIG